MKQVFSKNVMLIINIISIFAFKGIGRIANFRKELPIIHSSLLSFELWKMFMFNFLKI